MGDEEPVVAMLKVGGRREQDWGMVGGTEYSLRKGLIRIAAGPSIVVGSAVAAADNTDQDMWCMSAGGQRNLRHCIGSLRIAWVIKMRWRIWDGRGERGGGAGEKDGEIEGIE